MLVTQKTAFAGKTYTIDTFPEDPEGETHELAKLTLATDRFELEGEIYGVNFPEGRGSYEISGGQLALKEEVSGAEVKLQIGEHGPEHFWPGRDIDITGLPQWDGQQITFHRVPDPSAFQVDLNHHEHNLVGDHRFVSPRQGSFEMQLNSDRSGRIVGSLGGKEIAWEGRWMSTYPMSYFMIEGTDDFLSWHNNHDHGNHHHPAPTDPVQEIKDMPVDVIATTTGPNADIRKVYGMVMNPS